MRDGAGSLSLPALRSRLGSRPAILRFFLDPPQNNPVKIPDSLLMAVLKAGYLQTRVNFERL